MTLIILLAAVLAGMFAIRKIYDKYWMYKLAATVNFCDNVAYEGDKTELIEVIVNDKPLPIPTLEIDFNLSRNLRFANSANSMVSDKLYRRDVFSLGGKKKITRRLELSCIKRGYFNLQNVGLMANNLFLTRKYHTSFQQSDEFYVYPRRVDSQKIAIPFNKIMGDVVSRNKMFDDPFQFGGIRDYSISDPMKYINWKASAKSGDLVVNLHESSLSQKVTIILDTYDSVSPIDDELNEEAIRIASALSERIIAGGVSLSILGNGFDMLSGEGLFIADIKGLDSVLIKKTLSRLIWDDRKSIDEVMNSMKITENTLYVLISKNITEGITRALERLSEKNSGLWILPYKNDKPCVQSRSFKVNYWQDDRSKI